METLGVTTSLVSQLSGEDATAKPTKRMQIVEAAATSFLRAGFGAISMDIIAAEANVSKRTVYSYFSTKESLFIAVMDMMCQHMAEPGESICPLGAADDGSAKPGARLVGELSSIDPQDLLTRVGRRFLGILTSPDGIALNRIIISEAHRFPELGRSFYEYGCRPLVDRLSAYFSAQADSHRLDIPDPVESAWIFLGMVRDPIHYELSVGVRDYPDQQEIDAHVARTVTRFLAFHGRR